MVVALRQDPAQEQARIQRRMEQLKALMDQLARAEDKGKISKAEFHRRYFPAQQEYLELQQRLRELGGTPWQP